MVFCSVIELYKRNSLCFLRFFVMDFASGIEVLAQSEKFSGGYSGFFVLTCSLLVFNILGLFLMFGLGLKLLQFTWRGKGFVHFLCEFTQKSALRKNGFSSNIGFYKVRESMILSLKNVSLKFLRKSKYKCKDDPLMGKKLVNSNVEPIDDDCDGEFSSENEEEHDAKALKRLVKIERQRAKMAYAELEKERMAAASAAEEAMAMILRLQSAKSLIEIEANQYRRWAEKKLEYDNEVIQSFEWIITKHECEVSELEEKLRLCRLKLKQYMKEDEVDKLYGFESSLSFLDSTMEGDLEDEQDNFVDMGTSVFDSTL